MIKDLIELTEKEFLETYGYDSHSENANQYAESLIDEYSEKLGGGIIMGLMNSNLVIIPMIERALRTGKLIEFEYDMDCDY